MEEVRFYTVEQVAKIFQTTPNTIYQKIKKGFIPIVSAMDNPRIPRAFIEAQETGWIENTNETFIERKLRKDLNSKDDEIKNLKETISKMLKIGREVTL